MNLFKRTLFISILTFLCSPLLSAQDVLRNNGASLNISTNATLYVSGDFTNQGIGTVNNQGTIRLVENITNSATFSSSGAGIIIFEGTIQQEILGTTAINTQDLTLNNSAGLQLSQDINIADELTLNNGNLDLNNRVIDLSTTGSLLNEASGRQIVDTDVSDGGYIQAQANLNMPSSVDVANLGIRITSTQNLGNTIIRRGHDKQDNIFNPNNSIERYYDIVPTNNSALDMTVRMDYFDNELDGKNEMTLEMWKSASAPHDEWERLDFDVRDHTTNFVEKASIPSASRFTLSDAATPLPITLLSFEAKLDFNSQENTNNVLLTWTTLNEIDNESFIIERSADLSTFEPVGSLSGQGTATGPFDYDYTDRSPFQGNETLYYRLKQIDFNGNFTYSPVRVVQNTVNDFVLNTFPNPFIESLTIDITTTQSEATSLTLLSNSGKLIFEKTLNLSAGTNQFQVQNLAQLSQGVYFLRAIVNQKVVIKKIIKQ